LVSLEPINYPVPVRFHNLGKFPESFFLGAGVLFKSRNLGDALSTSKVGFVNMTCYSGPNIICKHENAVGSRVLFVFHRYSRYILQNSSFNAQTGPLAPCMLFILDQQLEGNEGDRGTRGEIWNTFGTLNCL
jgi:hypothetical protein